MKAQKSVKQKKERQRDYVFDESKVDYFNDFDFELWSTLQGAEEVISKARGKELNQFQLTIAQAQILHRLMNADKGLTIYEISRWSIKELASILTLINRMDKIGLVEKRRGEKNKINVKITEKGRSLYLKTSRHSIDMIFSILSNDEKQLLKSSLLKLRDHGRELLGVDFIPPFLKQ